MTAGINLGAIANQAGMHASSPVSGDSAGASINILETTASVASVVNRVFDVLDKITAGFEGNVLEAEADSDTKKGNLHHIVSAGQNHQRAEKVDLPKLDFNNLHQQILNSLVSSCVTSGSFNTELENTELAQAKTVIRSR